MIESLGMIFFGLWIVIIIFLKVCQFAFREKNPVPVRIDDGGRKKAGYQGTTGDCVTRALAIVSGRSYADIYRFVDEVARKTPFKDNSASQGVNGYITHSLMEYFGGVRYKFPPNTFLQAGLLPYGVLIADLDGHVVAIIDGVAYDNHEDETKQVIYGYWAFPDRRIENLS